MIYTLSRYQNARPQPPFLLGGEYRGRPDAHFLGDAFSAFELRGASLLFQGLAEGDLITVEVQAAEEGRLAISKLRVEVKAEAGGVGPRPHAAPFAKFLGDVRAFFGRRGLRECITPTLVVCPGLEPTLDAFATEVTRGDKRKPVYLPTSPEIHLKKAIARGWHDVFEIKTCFRQNEFSPHHQSEFHMLEWYRGFADLEMILDDLDQLTRALADRGWFTCPQIDRTDFATLFREHFQFELKPQSTREDLVRLAERLKIELAADDTFSDIFHRVMIEKLEPELKARGPTVVRRFPPSEAALAKFDAQGWADRFEFYWNGLEIANAFNEVNDPEEQRARWKRERSERARLKRGPLPEDPELIAALRRGFPPTGGIALGLERLYMAGTRIHDIRDLRLFSVDDLFSNASL